MPLRSKNMRGYGSWSMGWKEAERNPGPPGDNSGCLIPAGILIILIAWASIQAGGLGILFGLAAIAGILNGLKR